MSTQNTPPAEDAVIEEVGMEWDLFWLHHRSKILLGIVAAVAVGGGSFVWYVTGQLRARAAEASFASAGDIAGYESVVRDFGGSMPAADALMRIAAAQREAGKLDESTATFNKFLAAFPAHPLAGGALLGVGQNQDAAGKAKEARATYQQVVARFPASYAAAFAGYCEAEILLREFQRDDARRVLEFLPVQFPGSHIAAMANARLSRTGAKQGAAVAAPQ